MSRGSLGATAPLSLLIAASVLVLLGCVAALAQDGNGGAMQNSDAAAGHTSVSGAQVYASSCAVCHGETGGGLAEARLAFPESHRSCSRCHRPSNPPVMSLSQVEMRQNNLFAIGDAPALKGEGAMTAHAGKEALAAYIRTAMPRYRPGSLSQEEAEAVAGFLLELNGR